VWEAIEDEADKARMAEIEEKGIEEKESIERKEERI